MLLRPAMLLAVLVGLLIPPSLNAQRSRYGLAFGTSLVGGGDSRVLVDAGDFGVTGAGQAGHHLRGMVEIPLTSAAVAFRAELFYNILHSHPNSYAVVSSRDTVVSTALSDRVIGLTGNFVASLSPRARVSPYFLLGAGAFLSQLGTNPDVQSAEVVVTRAGMGIGLQTGVGMRVRLGARHVLFEWRYGQALNNTRGAGFMPLTVGVLF